MNGELLKDISAQEYYLLVSFYRTEAGTSPAYAYSRPRPALTEIKRRTPFN